MKNIISLSFAERSLLFAQLSQLSYKNNEEIEIELTKMGFSFVSHYDCSGSQAYSFCTDTDMVIVSRGTESDCWKDIRTNLRTWPTETKSGGKVHKGFLRYSEYVWPKIVKDLRIAKESKLNVWFTGHSLGGAIALILASFCESYSFIPTPIQVYTYGAPRVGWRKFVKNLNVSHIRWVNNNDVVAYVPTKWMGYRHHGSEFYMNSWGNVREMSAWQRAKDKLRGYFSSWRNKQFSSFSDHLIQNYIKNLKAYAKDMEFVENKIIRFW